MPSAEARDVLINEAAFRMANERMAAWPERHAGEREERYYCECADRGCRERVLLSRDAYEAVRRVPRHFAVVPGHVVEELESVVERHPGYEVVEKPATMAAMADETNPRDPRTGPHRAEAEATAAEIEREDG